MVHGIYLYLVLFKHSGRPMIGTLYKFGSAVERCSKKMNSVETQLPKNLFSMDDICISLNT